MAGVCSRHWGKIPRMAAVAGWHITKNIRCLATSPVLHKQLAEKELQEDVEVVEKKGWFKNLLRVRTIPTSSESHSSQLSDKEVVYEIQFHAVKPEYMEDYLTQFGQFQELLKVKDTGAELIGSFTVEIGEQDEAIHIWEFKGGYPMLNRATEIYRMDQDFIQFRRSRNKMLRYRRNQILLPFSFWPEPTPRPPTNIYELRSYLLKPGTMIEWGNNWARGIQQRQTNNEPVAGFFSQMGQVNVAHHIWGYKDLQTRKETREAAWQRPGWDECVAYTVPLIRHMESKILIPTPFSPLQ
ncbi:protein NipSnap-like [Gigantopelta aegis]|uniref:protein NipSnap-like n=1 Tax=Gigantopelta aegis TaxID=1735272 RepID=UPI001B88D8F7|nr:protein NipSnap-like [Gigantopelta aegis]